MVCKSRQTDGAEVAVREEAAGEGQAGASAETVRGMDGAADCDNRAGVSQHVAAGMGTETEVSSSSSRHIANGECAEPWRCHRLVGRQALH